MNNYDLENLYRSTEEDMQFAIGPVALPGREPAPIVQIRYRDWTRKKLEVIRESFTDGVVLVSTECATGALDLYIPTQSASEDSAAGGPRVRSVAHVISQRAGAELEDVCEPPGDGGGV